MHLLVSLAAHGWHPAAWRTAAVPGFTAAAPYRAAAQAAERGGLDAVLLGMPGAPADCLHLDPLPLLGAMIDATQQIGLGAFWPVDVAEPFHVARVFATLDHLSGGRTAWVAGRAAALGERHRHLAPPEDATAREAEFIDVARQLWDSWEDRGFVADQASATFADPAHVHPIDHAGPYFTVRGPLNLPRPVQGQPVILHPDVPDGPARTAAAASAELVLARCATIAEAQALRVAWKAQAAAQGRDPAGLRLILRVMPILAETEDAAQARAAALDAAADPVPRFAGTPGQFAAWLAAWHGAGACDGFDILPAVLPVDLDLLVGSVVPVLRGQGLRRAGYEYRTLREHLGLARSPSRFAA